MPSTAQPSLFDRPSASASPEEVLLYALGEFQARGHKLADREMALDRLRHAVDRACSRLRVETADDETIALMLEKIGARVVHIPDYFAKRPYRVTVPSALASRAVTVYHQINGKLS
ncbi:MAG: hypothetical protein HOP17_09915 [Acidobacteria bacterium]|nr:hypothetical protein [Acidobacteriota bacterium]